ncbi:MAG: amidophosphoribosyltransferase [Gemmatimonadetes bacterium]|nr:amidophosphoribosyltransferase [Gemmatimonadota bacterium]
MCGIFGIRGHPDAAAMTQLGLYSLQHRGQESSGILSVDDTGEAHLERAMGLVSEGLQADQMTHLPGRIAIGHTRYSTAGSSTIDNAQPILARTRGQTMSLAHNGNLVNAVELRNDLESSGAIFSSTMDSEVLLHRLARSRAETPEGRMAEALQGVEGAYCLVVTIGDALVLARDPRGWRPLTIGKLGDAYVAASESCALDIVGARFVCELEPGSIVRIEGSRVDYLEPLTSKPLKRCVFELVYFSRPDSTIFGESVDQYRRKLGHQLAREHPAPLADCVFSVPDSSNAAALGFSEESGIRLEHALIRNHYVGRTFIHPVQAGRDAKVRIKYNAVREIIGGKKVVVVDDSIVRGTTSRGLVSMIRQAGAREVHFRVASPPTTGPCYYGIDTPTREELIASSHSIEEIRRFLDVDSLGYLSLDGMLHASAGDTGRFCDACFSNRYPTPVPADPAKLRLETDLARTR